MVTAVRAQAVECISSKEITAAGSIYTIVGLNEASHAYLNNATNIGLKVTKVDHEHGSASRVHQAGLICRVPGIVEANNLRFYRSDNYYRIYSSIAVMNPGSYAWHRLVQREIQTIRWVFTFQSLRFSGFLYEKWPIWNS